MLSVTADFYRVLRYCHRWGIDVRIEPYVAPIRAFEDLANWHDAPTVMGHIEWPARRIWWTPVACDQDDAPVALLHELSHCVDPKDPEKTDEMVGPFLAFEYYSTRYLRIAGRAEWMRHYGLGDDGEALTGLRYLDWGDAPVWIRSQLIRESFAKAVAVGTLTPDGRPTFRLPPIERG